MRKAISLIVLSILTYVTPSSAQFSPPTNNPRIVGDFGPRNEANFFHAGIDYGPVVPQTIGDVVKAVEGGRIERIKYQAGTGGFGWYVKIRGNSTGKLYWYGHLFEDFLPLPTCLGLCQTASTLLASYFISPSNETKFVNLELKGIIDNITLHHGTIGSKPCYFIVSWTVSTPNKAITNCHYPSVIPSLRLGPTNLTVNGAVSTNEPFVNIGRSGAASASRSGPHLHLAIGEGDEATRWNPLSIITHEASNFVLTLTPDSIGGDGLLEEGNAEDNNPVEIGVEVNSKPGLDVDQVQLKVFRDGEPEEVVAEFKYGGQDGKQGERSKNVKTASGDESTMTRVKPGDLGKETFLYKFDWISKPGGRYVLDAAVSDLKGTEVVSNQPKSFTIITPNGTYEGSFAGTDFPDGEPAESEGGDLSFSVTKGAVTVTTPGPGSGTVQKSGSATFKTSGSGSSSGTTCTFGGNFNVGKDGSASAKGTYNCTYSGGHSEGTWNADRI
jgi:hypothetical protein